MSLKHRLELPDLEPCPNPLCDDGKAKKHVCAACNGLAVVDKKTGEALAPEVGYPALRKALSLVRQRLINSEKRRKELEGNQDGAFDPYGELPEHLGGKWRMD